MSNSRSTKKLKQKQRLATIEAALPDNEKLLSANREWDNHYVQQVSIARQYDYDLVRGWFIDFVTDEDLDSLQLRCSVEDAQGYFTSPPHNRVPSIRILRMFLEYLAKSRRGKIDGNNGRMYYRTLHVWLNNLAIVFRRAQNPLDKELLDGLHVFIDSELVLQGYLGTKASEKHTMTDLTMLTKGIFSKEFASTFSYTRYILYLALWCTMFVDCGGRISEFLWRPQTNLQVPGKFLAWCHVEFFAFTTPSGNTTLRATVRFNNLKSPVFDPTKHKTIPLRFLPNELANEDSMRFLVCLAIIERVFHGLDSFDDIQSLPSSPTGIRLNIRDELRHLPVFRRVGLKRKLTAQPLTDAMIRSKLRELGVYLGLEHRLLPGCLRRGAAFLLATNCTAEERTARMGHKDRDSVYWSHYRNETLTNDFQAIVHQCNAEDLTIMGSMKLNIREGAPRAISDQGIFDSLQDPELKALAQQKEDIYDRIVAQYKTISNAQTQDPLLYAQFSALMVKHSNTRRKLFSNRFKQEYREFFHTALQTPTHNSTLHTNKDIPLTSIPSNVFADSASAPPGIDLTDLIDPQLLIDNPENDSLYPVLDTNEADTAGSSSDIFQIFELEGSNTTAPQSSAHNQQCLSQEEVEASHPPSLDSTKLSKASSKRYPDFLVNLIPIWEVSSILTSESPDFQDPEFGNAMVQSYGALHSSDEHLFLPGLEPTPGSSCCRFCDGDLNNIKISRTAGFLQTASHVFACYKDHFRKSYEDRLSTLFPQAQCTAWISGKTEDNAIQQCKYGRDVSKTKLNLLAGHVGIQHVRPLWGGSDYSTESISCTFGDCYSSDTPFQSHFFLEFQQHLFMEHSLRTARRGSTHKPPSPLVFMASWCTVCNKFVCQTEEDVNAHILGHIRHFNKILVNRGYTGLYYDRVPLEPQFCPVCIRDMCKPLMERFNPTHTTNGKPEDLWNHLYSVHFKRFDQLPSILPCPLSVSTPDGIEATCTYQNISKSQFLQHLLDHHAWDLESAKEIVDIKNQRSVEWQKKQKLKKRGTGHDSQDEDNEEEEATLSIGSTSIDTAARQDSPPIGAQQNDQRIALGGLDTNQAASPKKPKAKKRK